MKDTESSRAVLVVADLQADIRRLELENETTQGLLDATQELLDQINGKERGDRPICGRCGLQLLNQPEITKLETALRDMAELARIGPPGDISLGLTYDGKLIDKDAHEYIERIDAILASAGVDRKEG